MSHTVVLELPDEVFQPLSRDAQRIGATPEQLAVQWLSAVSRRSDSDPLERSIGALNTGIPDWGGEHDQLLGESLKRELNGSGQE